MRSSRNAAEYTVSVVDRTGKAIHTVSTNQFFHDRYLCFASISSSQTKNHTNNLSISKVNKTNFFGGYL